MPNQNDFSFTKGLKLKDYYQNLVSLTIPITRDLGWQIKLLEANQIETEVPLDPNINIHHTAFAGSIFATGMATGWTLCHAKQTIDGFETDLVAGEATIRYIAPIESDFQCYASIDESSKEFKKLHQRLNNQKSAAYPLNVDIYCNARKCAILTIHFVFRPMATIPES